MPCVSVVVSLCATLPPGWSASSAQTITPSSSPCISFLLAVWERLVLWAVGDWVVTWCLSKGEAADLVANH
uniref:Secreted protein n=1 Tax=Fagus sylvatica TaxID=28930 RepID=A0A2N9EMA5_FAGSY